MKIVVTGGAGFIGSSLVKFLIKNTHHSIINIDNLTYAGNVETLSDIFDHERHIFEQIDITDKNIINSAFKKYKPDAVMHLAAESHVDRSIDNSFDFINTNIIGTYNLLEASLSHWMSLKSKLKNEFRFLHVSTDEVYGDLGSNDPLFNEENAYKPSSPYSASKASSDHLVRAWQRTYKLPTLITNCSNNYGPFHYPEKLIPLTISNALSGKEIPIFGKGNQIRDWLFVEDHVSALYKVLCEGRIGETYNIGGLNEKTNLEVVKTICNILDEIIPCAVDNTSSYKELIRFVKDRPGHDVRYAIDNTKISNELNWKPLETFDSGIKKTVEWYINNREWTSSIINKK
tara:strand:+ start:1005 stop:2039 length:1035 start_codon:yes stop_codon:yes gene_type:complete